MRYSREDVADATQRIISIDSELGAEINKYKKKQAKPIWVSQAAKASSANC